MNEIDLTAQRVALNQATFRDANEKIEAVAAQLEPEVEPVPFLCECPRRNCMEITRLTLSEYETVRGRSTWFLVSPGHEVCEVDGVTVARPLKRGERYTTMEKLGEAGEIAVKLDRRTA